MTIFVLFFQLERGEDSPTQTNISETIVKLVDYIYTDSNISLRLKSGWSHGLNQHAAIEYDNHSTKTKGFEMSAFFAVSIRGLEMFVIDSQNFLVRGIGT